MSIEVDISDAENELNRLINGADGETILAFEAVLATQFALTKQVVHVVTRSLKNSATMDSEKHPDRWTGEIKFGGPSLGSVHDPVTYAKHEYDRGGDHDFLAPAKDMDGDYIEPMKKYLKG